MTNYIRSQRFVSILALCAFSAMVGSPALAQTHYSSDPSANDAHDTRASVKARYEADKKLCAEETSSAARLQCRRDAQVLYDKALAALPTKGVYKTAPAQCADCGHVTAVTMTDKAGDSNAVGAIAGGVAGAVLGRQVGGGFGKDLATIAGAAGGAYAGKKIQENMGTSKVWTVSVKYTSGQTANFEFAQDPGLSVGDAVKNAGNTLVRN